MQKRLPIAAIILLFIGFGCMIAYRLIGSTIDSNGFLHEPFGLIPIGGLCILLGLIAGCVHFIGYVLRKWRHKKQ